MENRVRLKNKLRVCADCLDDIQKDVASQWSDGFILGKYNAESACHGCGELRGERGQLNPFYVVAFDLGGKRHNYFASYCPACSRTQISTWGLQNGD